MAAIYEIRTFTPAGVALARISDYKSFVVQDVVNKPGLLTMNLEGDHPAIAALSHLSQIEVWRKDDDNGLDWYRYWGGLYIGERWSWNETKLFQLTAVGYLWFLFTRIINWRAGLADRSKFTTVPAETIMKTLVDYNAGADATTGNGRKRTGTITGITTEADGANGNSLDWNCHGQNLLESLQKLANVAGGDFDLVKTGAQAWEFRWYTEQLGTDRTASVKFSLSNGNMGQPVYDRNRIGEKTVAAVWGQGSDSSRTYVTRPAGVVSPDIELYVDAKDLDTQEALEARGDDKLYANRADGKFTFKVLKTPSTVYGVHYFLGDLVKVRNPFTGTESTQKITSATISRSEDGRESIDIEVTTP